MSLDPRAIFNAASSHAQTLGIFDRVGTHEPKNAPGNGLTAAFWMGPITCVPGASGLDAVSARIELLVRIYNPMLQQPYDDIDPTVMDAISQLFGAYAGDFTLGGLVRDVDLFGQHGTGLSSRPGYINQDGKIFRSVDITLPLIINDLWDEVA